MPPVKTALPVFSSPGKVSRQNSPKSGPRILLVDDDEVLRELVAEALIMNGYEVVCAGDGEEGWDSLCQLEFDLMITDHNMPRLNGLDLISRMQCGLPQVPTIMITGYVPYKFETSDKILPFCDVMAKPFSLQELLQKVDNSLKLAQA